MSEGLLVWACLSQSLGSIRTLVDTSEIWCQLTQYISNSAPNSNVCLFPPIPPILWHQLVILQFNSDTIYLEMYSDPTGQGLRTTRVTPPPLHPSTSDAVTGVSEGQVINQRFQRHPSLGLINLLEQLTELRKTFYMLDYWFILKGFNSGTGRWKRCIRRGVWERVLGFCVLIKHTTFPKSPRVHQLRSSPNPILLGCYGGFIA